jgi:regulator of sigma E protease
MDQFLGVLKFIGILLEVLLIFNLLIVVHELGHFLAAKWRGLVIEGFGIWFGKPIWKKKINGVLYTFGSIPFGGFVKLPQLMDTALEGQSEYAGKELPKLKPLDKIIVAAAGPAFSLLLAFVFALLVWGFKRPMGEAEATTTIGFVVPDSPAEKAGLKQGDEIVSVDGIPVTRFGGQADDSVMWRIVRSENSKIALEYKRDGKLQKVEIEPLNAKTKWYERRALPSIGIGAKSTPMVADVKPGSRGAKAGLQPNDVIVKVEGQPIYDDDDIAQYAHDHDLKTVKLDVWRGKEGEQQTVQGLEYEVQGVVVGGVIEGSPAAAAGLKAGDKIVKVDGKPFHAWRAFTKYIHSHLEKPVALEVERSNPGGAPVIQNLTVTPQIPIEGGETIPGGEKKPSIGVSYEPDNGFVLDMFGPRKLVRQGPFEQIRISVNQITNTIGAVASKSQIGVQHMGGPVMMMRVYYNLFESPFGWQLALWFSVIINVNLALLNLLPIPPLDGSHITLGIVELIRGKPVRGRLLEYIVAPFTLLVIGFMLFVTFFDVQDLFGGKKPPMRFKPQTPAVQSSS